MGRVGMMPAAMAPVPAGTPVALERQKAMEAPAAARPLQATQLPEATREQTAARPAEAVPTATPPLRQQGTAAVAASENAVGPTSAPKATPTLAEKHETPTGQPGVTPTAAGAVTEELALAAQPGTPTTTPTPPSETFVQPEGIGAAQVTEPVEAGAQAREKVLPASPTVAATATAPASPPPPAPATPTAVPEPLSAKQADMMRGPGEVPPQPAATSPPGPSPTLMPVEALQLAIEPGVIRVAGRLPLPEGQPILAELWRDGQRLEWAVPETQRGVVEAEGRFALRLEARPDVPGRDLLRTVPASYEIRIRPVDPAAPLEARIPFDTHPPPPLQ
jgi:hypothetical protein